VDTEKNTPDGFVRIKARDLYQELVAGDLLFNNSGKRGIIDHLEERPEYFVVFFNDVFGRKHGFKMDKESDFFRLDGEKENLLLYRGIEIDVVEINVFIHKK